MVPFPCERRRQLFYYIYHAYSLVPVRLLITHDARRRVHHIISMKKMMPLADGCQHELASAMSKICRRGIAAITYFESNP